MQITNSSGARQGVHTTNGLVWLKPGETRDDLVLSHTEAERAGRLPFLILSGEPVGDAISSATAQEGGDSAEMAALRRQFDASWADLLAKKQDLETQLGDRTRELAAARTEIEDLRRAMVTTPIKLEAKHRGGGSYSVMDADGKEVLEKLSKADAEAFNAMSVEEQAEYVKASTKA